MSVPVSILRFRPGLVVPDRVYLDTNVLLHARDQGSSRYRTASLCLRELIQQRVELSISALVVDELWWALFKLSYRLLTGQELTSQEYKHHVEIWRNNWPTVRRITDEILAWKGLTILDSTSATDLVREAAALIDMNPLGPRDAFHLALVLRHSIPGIVTADRDFDHVQQIPAGKHVTIVKL